MIVAPPRRSRQLGPDRTGRQTTGSRAAPADCLRPCPRSQSVDISDRVVHWPPRNSACAGAISSQAPPTITLTAQAIRQKFSSKRVQQRLKFAKGPPVFQSQEFRDRRGIGLSGKPEISELHKRALRKCAIRRDRPKVSRLHMLAGLRMLCPSLPHCRRGRFRRQCSDPLRRSQQPYKGTCHRKSG